MVIIVLFLLSVVSVKTHAAEGGGVSGSFVALVCVLLAAAVALLFYLRQVVSFFVRLVRKAPRLRVLMRSRIVRMLVEKGDSAAEYLRGVSDFRSRATTGALSFLIWTVKFAGFFVLLGGILGGRGSADGAIPGYWKVVFGTTFAELTTMLPIYAPLGPYEAAWTVAFMSVGVEKEMATSTAFAFHVLLIFSSAVFAGLGSLCLLGRRKRED